jgi:hypothetical protein
MGIQVSMNKRINARMQEIEAISSKTRYLPEFPDEMNAEAILSYDNSFRIIIPYNFEFINQVRRLLTEQNWAITHEHSDGINNAMASLNFYCTYNDTEKDVFLHIWFASWRKGSTCKVQQIGTRNVIEPIYEVVCADAGSEDTWGSQSAISSTPPENGSAS